MWILSSNSDVKLPVAQIEMISFMKNLALMGAMLFIIANGPGPMSVDARLAAMETNISTDYATSLYRRELGFVPSKT